MHYRFILITVMLAMSIFCNQYAIGSSANNGASAQTRPALVMEQLSELNFGNFTHTAGGTINTNHATDPSRWALSGGITRVAGGSTPSIGNFRITGGANETIDIALGSGQITLRGAGDSDNEITVDLRLHRTNASRTSLSGKKLNSNGRRSVNVFGTATLAANQQADTYQGTYSITVSYQ